jgi:hypothetical protein
MPLVLLKGTYERFLGFYQKVNMSDYLGFTERYFAFQSGVPKSFCDDPKSTFTSTIIIKIAKLGGTGGSVVCCTQDGCNWNATTAQNNQVKRLS